MNFRLLMPLLLSEVPFKNDMVKNAVLREQAKVEAEKLGVPFQALMSSREEEDLLMKKLQEASKVKKSEEEELSMEKLQEASKIKKSECSANEGENSARKMKQENLGSKVDKHDTLCILM